MPAESAEPLTPDEVTVGEPVVLDDGARGVVVGFFRREAPSVLVRLDGGGTIEVSLDDLRS